MERNAADFPAGHMAPKRKSQDKRLYKVGDRTAQGDEIFRIYCSTPRCIVYQAENGSLGWEIDDLPIGLPKPFPSAAPFGKRRRAL